MAERVGSPAFGADWNQHDQSTIRDDSDRASGRVSIAFLFLAAFIACAVEMVEALTIVLAVGTTRGWRSPLIGAGTAAIALVVIIAILGPALTRVRSMHCALSWVGFCLPSGCSGCARRSCAPAA